MGGGTQWTLQGHFLVWSIIHIIPIWTHTLLLWLAMRRATNRFPRMFPLIYGSAETESWLGWAMKTFQLPKEPVIQFIYPMPCTVALPDFYAAVDALWVHSQHLTSTVFQHLSISFCPKTLSKATKALQVLVGIAPKCMLEYSSKGYLQPVRHGSQWINTLASCSSEQQFHTASCLIPQKVPRDTESHLATVVSYFTIHLVLAFLTLSFSPCLPASSFCLLGSLYS